MSVEVGVGFDEERQRAATPMRSIPCLHCGSPEAEHGFHGRCETAEWRGTGAKYTVGGDAGQGPTLLVEGGDSLPPALHTP